MGISTTSEIKKPTIINLGPKPILKINPLLGKNLNLDLPLTTYQSCFDFLKISVSQAQTIPGSVSGYIYKNKIASVISRYDIEKNPNFQPLRQKINAACDRVKEYFNNPATDLNDPIAMGPHTYMTRASNQISARWQGYAKYHINNFGRFSAAFVPWDILSSMQTQKIEGGKITAEKTLSDTGLSLLYTTRFLALQSVSAGPMGLPLAGSYTFAWGGPALVALHGTQSEQQGIAVLNGAVNISAFIAASQLTASKFYVISKTGAIPKFTGASIAHLSLCAGVTTLLSMGLNNFYMTDVGQDLLGNGFSKNAGKVMTPMTDWLMLSAMTSGTYSLSAYSASKLLTTPSLFKLPVGGPGVLAIIGGIGQGVSNFDKLISGDYYTTIYGGYNIIKEGGIIFVSGIAAAGIGGACIESGPGAFFVGAAVYTASNIGIRKGAEAIENETGVIDFFERTILKEPLADIGIALEITERSGRPSWVLGTQREISISDIRSFLDGYEKFETEKGKKVNLQEELKRSGIKRIVMESRSDLTPIVLWQVIKAMAGKKADTVKLTYDSIITADSGTYVSYALYEGSNKKPAPALILNPIELASKKSISFSDIQIINKDGIEINQPAISLNNQNPKYSKNANDIFGKPNIITLQLGKVLLDLGVIASYSADPTSAEFIKVIKDKSYKGLKNFLEDNDDNRDAAINIMTRALVRFNTLAMECGAPIPCARTTFGAKAASWIYAVHLYKTSGENALDSFLANRKDPAERQNIKKIIINISNKAGNPYDPNNASFNIRK